MKICTFHMSLYNKLLLHGLHIICDHLQRVSKELISVLYVQSSILITFLGLNFQVKSQSCNVCEISQVCNVCRIDTIPEKEILQNPHKLYIKEVSQINESPIQ